MSHSRIQDVALELNNPQHFVVLCKLILVMIFAPSIFTTLGNCDQIHVQDTSIQSNNNWVKNFSLSFFRYFLI